MTLPKTAQELQQILEQRNLYPWYAAANGTDPNDGYALRKETDGWVVYSVGPGAIPNERRFSLEQDAVADLVERLWKHGFAHYVRDLRQDVSEAKRTDDDLG